LKPVLAHFVSVYTASGALMLGLGALDAGLTGALEFAARWFGGFLIFGILAMVSLPLGLFIRYLALKFLKPSFAGSVGIGVSVSWILVFILYPAMMPPLSFETAPFGLLLSHGIAGAVGGWVWWLLDKPIAYDTMTLPPAA
jgi:hypothetical protein